MAKKTVRKVKKVIDKKTSKSTPAQRKRPIEQYRHTGKDRINIPEVGLVTFKSKISCKK